MIHYDTRKIKPSDVFIAIDKGEKYINRELAEKVSRIIKLNKREVYQYLINYWGIDINKIKIIGITGTNGKTTTTFLIKQILEAWGKKCRILGTITNSLTTPELFDVLCLIKEMIDLGEEYLIMEVSSIGIVENRIYGLPFTVKGLTNITRDHLDYHKTFKNYVKSKFEFLTLPGITVYPKEYKQYTIDFPMFLKGKFNLFNAKLAATLCSKLGVPENVIKSTLAVAKPPKGRFQIVEGAFPLQIIVDYAHTPDGLDNVLSTIQEMKTNRVITVFGAGGNRDKTKRPLMAKAVEKKSDFIFVTSDNPRLEEPKAIIKDVLKGFSAQNKYKVVEDRKKAIYEAVNFAKQGDIVLIAGKGHENYQIIGETKHHFDDYEIAEKYLHERFD